MDVRKTRKKKKGKLYGRSTSGPAIMRTKRVAHSETTLEFPTKMSIVYFSNS